MHFSVCANNKLPAITKFLFSHKAETYLSKFIGSIVSVSKEMLLIILVQQVLDELDLCVKPQRLNHLLS